MRFPHFRNKHLEPALFNPQDYITWAKYFQKHSSAPSKYILLYYPKILNYFKRNYEFKKTKINRLISIYNDGDIGVVCMTGIGSPHAVTVLEELIALGGRQFLNIGSAGGLNGLGTFLCDKAIRDEGTSHHYVPSGKYAYPDEALTDRLERSMKRHDIDFNRASTWTIDAPYRETKREILSYRKQGVATVDMEASALFTVAKVRGVKIASAFVVSDVLGDDSWQPKFRSTNLNRGLYRLFDAAYDCLKR